MKRGVYLSLGYLFIIIGLTYVVHAANNKITGGFILDHMPVAQSSLTGLFFLFVGAHFLSISRKRRGGQAAMEFLMTYGWAILASITALSLLAYFGVFGGGSFLGGSSKVVLSGQIFGEAIGITPEAVQVQIKNAGGTTITLQTASLTNLPEGQSCPALSNIGQVLSAGETYVLNIAGCQGLSEGDRIKGDISITYTKSGSQLDQQASGTFSGTVGESTGESGGGFGEDIYAPQIFVENEPYNALANERIDVVAITDEDATCIWVLNEDLGYSEMLAQGSSTPCLETVKMEYTCTIEENTLTETSTMYIACVDASQNENEFDNNAMTAITILSEDPPVQSGHNPADSSQVSKSFNTYYNLDVTGDCKWDLTDLGYDEMVNNCQGDGTTEITCAINLEESLPGLIGVYFSCKGTQNGIADTSSSNTLITYDLSGK